MNNKPVDLGALQDALRNADVLVKSTQRTYDHAYGRYENILSTVDAAKKRRDTAIENRNAAKRAVVEGARQVASST